MSILIGTDHGCRNEISTVKGASCGDCSVDVIYRTSSRRLSRLLKEGRGGKVACPHCGWSKFSVSSADKVPRSFKALTSWFKRSKPEKVHTSSRGVVVLHERGPNGPEAEELERELFSLLRCALLCMAGIDGEVHPSEVMAISNIYRSVTNERVDIGTLEQQANSAIGKHEKMLDCLDCLSPYLDYESKMKFLKAVTAVAAADGRIDPAESKLLDDTLPC